jgi:hypothetical protein
MDILALLPGLQPDVPVTTLRQFSRIASAMLVLTGRVTMLGISRWAGQGGSYRTIGFPIAPEKFCTVGWDKHLRTRDEITLTNWGP